MSLTHAQREAIAARGNVLVMAGAGTGKTSTLVARCVDCLGDTDVGASLDELLVVTFTEAAAAEVRKRVREELEKRASLVARASRPCEENKAHTGGTPVPLAHWAEQLALFDTAHIGTLHGFCSKLIQQHFYELGLDPQVSVLDAGQARLMANETLDAMLQGHYAARTEASEAVRRLIHVEGGGRDKLIRTLVLRLHHYTQTRPDPDAWFASQRKLFASPEPEQWRAWLAQGIADWRTRWQPALAALAADGNRKAAEGGEILECMTSEFSRKETEEILGRIQKAGVKWDGKKTVWQPPLKKFFSEAAFLASLVAQNSKSVASPIYQSDLATESEEFPTNSGEADLDSPDTVGLETGDLIVSDPLAEDWEWTRRPMMTLLRLAEEFSARFSADKREAGVLDFHDLEQFTLRLLWDFAASRPTAIAEHWRRKIQFVFVDEYQDINAAQDRIITALSRGSFGVPPSGGSKREPPEGGTPNPGNRFLVGDVKQSIYRFRQADPEIFRKYAAVWRGDPGKTIPLRENFRSHERVLQFVNSVFSLLMRSEVGGVAYDDEAQLQFGAPEERQPFSAATDAAPRAELILRVKGGHQPTGEAEDVASDALAELEDAEKEARLVALRLRELQRAGRSVWDNDTKEFRPVEWRDMAVLLRAPSNKAESYAKEFAKLGVPLVVERGGFYQSTEVTDLLSLLQVLDNPQQDLPVIAVLRSPLVGLSLDELATVRLVARGHFWTALRQWRETGSQGSVSSIQYSEAADHAPDLSAKVDQFLGRFQRWRKLARQASLSRCLETVLAETHYADWLRAQPRGEQRYANVQKLLALAQQFDQFQRQGLFRFLRFIEAQQEAEAEPEVASAAEQDAVRLMSIHQSKGLEFPVVVVADLGKRFNEQDLHAEIILDEFYGLCPQIKAPQTGRRYPSLPYWLAQLRQKRELRGEELRLLYVAMARARDTVILTGGVSEKKWRTVWRQKSEIPPQSILAAQSYMDWLGLWFAQNVDAPTDANVGESPHLRWSVYDDSRLVSPITGTDETEAAPDVPALDAESVERLRGVLTWEYPFGAATRHSAKTSVTALRRQAAERDEEAQPLFPEGEVSTRVTRRIRPAQALPGLSAVDLGIAHHKFLQHVRLEETLDVPALQREAQRLERGRVLSAEEAAALNFEKLAAFWQSEIGGRIRNAATHVRRELPFTARFSPQELAAITGEAFDPSLNGEFVVVQGVADLAVLLPQEIWLVDFKTDDLQPAELAAKSKFHAAQLKLYARALSQVYQRPVTECWLHFIAPQRTVRVEV